RLLDQLEGVDLRARRPRVPAVVLILRIGLAEAPVVHEAHQRVGQEQLEIRALCGGPAAVELAAPLDDLLAMVIPRLEAVGERAVDEPEQRVDALRLTPGGTELAPLVERGDEVRRMDPGRGGVAV